MTDASSITFAHIPDLTVPLSDPEPDLIEHLFREQFLRLLYWHVEEQTSTDEGMPDLADLTVIFTNGRRYFKTQALLDLNIVYGLVGQDAVTKDTALWAMDTLLGHAREIEASALSLYATDDDYAEAISDWRHSDAELICSVLEREDLDPDVRALLEASISLVASVHVSTSLADPVTQLAAVAVRIAWEHL